MCPELYENENYYFDFQLDEWEITLAIIDLLKWSGSNDIIVWKHPSEELSTWTQLIVNESQEAYLVRGGVYEGPFGPGRHTLSTENIPIIRELYKIPFGRKSPFSAEVWYVNKLINLDVKWGTSDPIQLQDPKFQIMVPVRAFGQYGIRVSESKKFLLKLVGTLSTFDASTVNNYFKGIFNSKIKSHIASAIVRNGQCILEIAAELENLSSAIKTGLRTEMAEYGLHLEQFNIESINFPEDDPALSSLKSALAKRAEMQIVGYNYQQERSFDVLQTAAGNEGTSGNIMGAGLGVGMGMGLGVPLGNSIAGITNSIQTSTSPSPMANTPLNHPEPIDKIKLLKELAELKTQGILTDIEFDLEKKKILGN